MVGGGIRELSFLLGGEEGVKGPRGKGQPFLLLVNFKHEVINLQMSQTSLHTIIYKRGIITPGGGRIFVVFKMGAVTITNKWPPSW